MNHVYILFIRAQLNNIRIDQKTKDKKEKNNHTCSINSSKYYLWITIRTKILSLTRESAQKLSVLVLIHFTSS